MSKLKKEIVGGFKEIVLTTARLVGELLASALGFSALAIISTIPKLTIMALIYMGFGEIAESLVGLEHICVQIDVIIFMVTTVIFSVIYVVEIAGKLVQAVKKVFKESSK